MKHIKMLYTLARRGALPAAVLAAGLLAACTGEFWADGSTADRTATSKPMALTPPPAPATEAQVARAQSLLTELGYAPGAVDGKVGPKTTTAVRAYQEKVRLAADGRISAALIERLEGNAETRQIAKAQRQLSALGYDPGPADGREGAQTRKAVEAFQEASGQPRDGQVTARLLAALDYAVAAQGGAPAQAAAAAEPAAASEPVVETSTGGLVVAAAAGAAAGSQAAAVSTETAAETAATATEAKAEQVAALAPRTGPLVPGERVLLSYLGAAEKPLALAVGADGRLALPEAGSVQAAGLELGALRDRVTVKLIESYMGKVDVKVDRGDGSGSAVLAPGDRVLVRLTSGQAAPNELEIGADGRLALADVGQVQAAGLGVAELEGEISVKLLESYMDKLDVTVERAP